jgi:hypothetical protein
MGVSLPARRSRARLPIRGTDESVPPGETRGTTEAAERSDAAAGVHPGTDTGADAGADTGGAHVHYGVRKTSYEE